MMMSVKSSFNILCESPYYSTPRSIFFGESSESCTILDSHLSQWPCLKERQSPYSNRNRNENIRLPDIDAEIGHTLLHYFYTKQFQLLGADETSKKGYQHSVLTYCAAGTYRVSGLQELAKERINHFSMELSILDVQEVMEAIAEKLPRNDEWLWKHLQKKMKEEFNRDSTKFALDGKVLNRSGKCHTFDRAALHTFAELYHEGYSSILERDDCLNADLDKKHSECVSYVNGVSTPDDFDAKSF